MQVIYVGFQAEQIRQEMLLGPLLAEKYCDLIKVQDRCLSDCKEVVAQPSRTNRV